MLPAEATAIIEIQQLLFRYCRGVDRGEQALLKGVYHPGATDSHGAFDGDGQAFAEALIPVMDATGLIGQHHITNTLISVEGDRARGESYFIAYHPGPIPGCGGIGLAIAGGRYLDVFERREDVWKIAERRVVMDFSYAPCPPAPWQVQATFPAGGRREQDPSHGFLPVYTG